MGTLSMLETLGRPDRGRKTLDLKHTREFMDRLLGEDVHARRVLSLANGVAGVLAAAMALTIAAIAALWLFVEIARAS